MTEQGTTEQTRCEALTDDELTQVAGGSDPPGGPGDNTGAR
jgi:hypothetical protein